MAKTTAPASSHSTATQFDEDLFVSVRYFVNDDVSEVERQEICDLLRRGGAQEVEAHPDKDVPDSRFQMYETTHVLAKSERFPEFSHCFEPSGEGSPADTLPVVVTPEWVRRSAQLNLLQREKYYSCLRRLIFSGMCVTASASQISRAEREFLANIIPSYGGIWRDDATSDVNYILTSTFSARRVRKLIQIQGPDLTIAAPAWINDSWRASKLLPLDNYVFDVRTGKPPPCLLAGPSTSTLTSSASRPVLASPSSPRSSPPAEKRNMLKDTTFLLARDICRASENQLRTLESLIHASGGRVRRAPARIDGITQAVRNSDYVITRYRDVQEFREAIRQDKSIGNLTWILSVLSRGVLTDPRDDLLHYPVARGGIPEMLGKTITVTGYRGEARNYVTKLIRMIGATFCGALTQKTTLCIAATMDSDKSRMARQWGVSVVNHRYIVDSFLAWTALEKTNLKYIDFPRGVDYNDQIGKDRVTDEGLAPWIRDSLDNDEPAEVPNSDAVTEPTSFLGSSSTLDSAAINGEAQQAEMDTNENVSNNLGGQIRDGNRADTAGRGKTAVVDTGGHTDSGGFDTPVSKDSEDLSYLRALKDMSENSVNRPQPSTPSPLKRKATRHVVGEAEDEEHDEANGDEDGADHLVNGTRRPHEGEEDEQDRNEDRENRSPRPAKKSRKGASSDPKPIHSRVTPTSTPKAAAANQKSATSSRMPSSSPSKPAARSETAWRVIASNYTIERAELAKLRALGIEVVDSMDEANVLVSPTLSRSPKMLQAIANGSIEIVHPSWLAACLKANEVVATSKHPLRDSAREKEHGTRLVDILDRRAQHTGGILHGHKFWMGRDVDKTGVIRELIAASGGEVLAGAPDDELLLSDAEHHHLIADESHRSDFKHLLGQTNEDGHPLRVYKERLITSAVFYQRLDWDHEFINPSATSSGSPARNGRKSGVGSNPAKSPAISGTRRRGRLSA